MKVDDSCHFARSPFGFHVASHREEAPCAFLFVGLGTRPDFLTTLLIPLFHLFVVEALIGLTIRLMVFPVGVPRVGILGAEKGCDKVLNPSELCFLVSDKGLIALVVEGVINALVFIGFVGGVFVEGCS